MVIVSIICNDCLKTGKFYFSFCLELTSLKQNAKLKKGRGFLTPLPKVSALNKKYIFDKLEEGKVICDVKRKLDVMPQKCKISEFSFTTYEKLIIN